ncbi:MAG: fibronectin type III domain-containing protein [Bacteroidetes bacterium]|nr:fibronectin type III domain-containing protein [Bacteroidota bacterium]
MGEFTTLTAPVCDVPSAITVSNISTTSATISWTGDIEATSYELQYKELSNPNWQSVIINAPTTTYTFSNLIQNTTYQYRLKTVCSFGESNFSSIGEFTTLTAPVRYPISNNSQQY